MPATSEVQSLNGLSVKISVERKTESNIFGTDFVSGGIRNYFGKIGEGYWIIAKTSDSTANLGDILGEAVKLKLGSYPIVMPETYVSHLTILLWEGKSDLEEKEILVAVEDDVRRNDLTLKPRSHIAEPRKGRLEGAGITLAQVERFPPEEQPAIRKTFDPRDGRFHPERLRPERKPDEAKRPSDMSEDEQDALAIVARNHREAVYPNMSDFDSLVRKGYLKKTGLLRQFYEVTDHGRSALGWERWTCKNCKLKFDSYEFAKEHEKASGHYVQNESQ